jgi:uncharacterized RDD family membrane protein YckC
VSDIPVGSPPVPPGRHAAPGGWYADPVDPARERYWDGWQWSRNTRPRETTHYARPAAASAPPGYPAQAGYPVQRGYPSYPAARTADGVRLAAWWWRALAALLDSALTSVVVTVVAFPVWRPVYAAIADYVDTVLSAQQSGATPPVFDATGLFPVRDQVIFTAISLAIGMIYHMAFLRWKGATPGKLICGLRVVPVDRGHAAGPLDWRTVGIRAAVWVLPGINSLLAFFTVIDVLFPLWHPKRQALHDLAAKTQVVRPGPDTGWPGARNFR